MNELEKLDKDLIERNTRDTRGHGNKIMKNSYRKDTKK